MKSPHEQSEIPTVSSSLLVRVQQMHPDAWARLVEVFSPIVYRWARQANLSGTDSADVVQDVFVAVARNVERFTREKQKASFRSWLATIARNRIRDFYRSKSIHPDGFGGTAALEQFNNIPAAAQNASFLSDDELEKSISMTSLSSRIPARVLEIVKDQCDTRTWKAFWMTTLEGISAAVVAEKLEMNVASVYQAKSRVLRRLRQRMDEIPK